MRQFYTAALLLVISTITLSCGDADFQEGAPVADPVIEKGDHPRLISESDGVRVTTLPTDDIADHILEMPDGIHLQPGVQIHSFDDWMLPYVEVERHSPIVKVTGPALTAFAQVNPNDGVFFGDYAFIVDGVTYEDDLMTLEVSTFELTRVVWGNFRIEYELPMSALLEGDEDITFEPIVDPLGNVTRQQASVTATAIAKTFKKGFNKTNMTGEFSGTFRFPYTLKGVFEGRIGSFKPEYTCRKDRSSRYCVDRIAAYVELSLEFQGKAKVSFGRQWTFNEDGDIIQPVTLARIPLGATGLSVNPAFFVRYEVEARAAGLVGLEYTFDYSKTAPVGFEYRDLPRGVVNNSGLFTIPNLRFPVQAGSTTHNLKPTGELSASGDARLEVGVELQIAFGPAPAKLIGPEVKGVMNAYFGFNPFARDSEGYCSKYGVKLFGEAVAKLEFEVDLRFWKVSKELTCDDCSVQSREFNLINPHTSSDTCLDRPNYDTLVVQYATGGPTGFESPGGYPIDALCVLRPTGSSFCATSGGGSAAHGRPDATTCSNFTSGGKVYPVTGSSTFKFGNKIRPGDTIQVVQSSVGAGGGQCRPGGRARFTLKGSGFDDVRFNNGNYYEGSPNLVVPQ